MIREAMIMGRRSKCNGSLDLSLHMDFDAIHEFRVGDLVYVSTRYCAPIQDTFNECCERAKGGDTNALGALPYLAERLISQAR